MKYHLEASLCVEAESADHARALVYRDVAGTIAVERLVVISGAISNVGFGGTVSGRGGSTGAFGSVRGGSGGAGFSGGGVGAAASSGNGHHRYGNPGWNEIERLDARIARLIEHLDARIAKLEARPKSHYDGPG